MSVNSSLTELTSRAEAAYLGLAIGDALGATVEFMTPHEIAAKYGEHRDICGGGWLNLKPGKVTDDTTMSLALGAAILSDGGEVVPLSCAHAFDGWMRSKPVDIGNTVRRNLISFRRTGNPEAAPSEYDAGNGAAMRVLPVALATLGKSPEVVRQAVRAQAHATHNNPVSDGACDFLTFAVQDFLLGLPLRSVYRQRIEPLLQAFPEFSYRSKRQENPSGWIVHTLHVVLQGLVDTDTFEHYLIDVTNRGGDADTTGAIAGMLGGALYGYDAIPKRWLKALEPATCKACRAQARELVALACARG
ncbi:ADP-ribosyl-[dinitrogen reductase] hydrolase [Propionivibrio limicola]|uniref:ADP-ribosyl-[dinitrogen reductase] hydrolase n=1 Tax=Propionivibrio limicola TaxID=167645 RepID=UPI0012927D01|nr:ADP-ribosyl-[dinitrogen reductase] hydrolase [Propionivibrio limicola]